MINSQNVAILNKIGSSEKYNNEEVNFYLLILCCFHYVTLKFLKDCISEPNEICNFYWILANET